MISKIKNAFLKLLHYTTKRRNFVNILFVITLSIFILTSLTHVSNFWGMTNTPLWANLMAIGTGMGILVAMISRKHTRISFVVFTFIMLFEVLGNVHDSFMNIDVNSFQYTKWETLTSPIFGSLFVHADGTLDNTSVMRITALLQGIFIPIMAAIVFNLWMTYNVKEDEFEEEAKKHTLNVKQPIIPDENLEDVIDTHTDSGLKSNEEKNESIPSVDNTQKTPLDDHSISTNSTISEDVQNVENGVDVKTSSEKMELESTPQEISPSGEPITSADIHTNPHKEIKGVDEELSNTTNTHLESLPNPLASQIDVDYYLPNPEEYGNAIVETYSQLQPTLNFGYIGDWTYMNYSADENNDNNNPQLKSPDREPLSITIDNEGCDSPLMTDMPNQVAKTSESEKITKTYKDIISTNMSDEEFVTKMLDDVNSRYNFKLANKLNNKHK